MFQRAYVAPGIGGAHALDGVDFAPSEAENWPRQRVRHRAVTAWRVHGTRKSRNETALRRWSAGADETTRWGFYFRSGHHAGTRKCAKGRLRTGPVGPFSGRREANAARRTRRDGRGEAEVRETEVREGRKAEEGEGEPLR